MHNCHEAPRASVYRPLVHFHAFRPEKNDDHHDSFLFLLACFYTSFPRSSFHLSTSSPYFPTSYLHFLTSHVDFPTSSSFLAAILLLPTSLLLHRRFAIRLILPFPHFLTDVLTSCPYVVTSFSYVLTTFSFLTSYPYFPLSFFHLPTFSPMFLLSTSICLLPTVMFLLLAPFLPLFF